MQAVDLSAVLIFPATRDLAFASLGFLKVDRMLTERLRVADITYAPGGAGDQVLSPRQGILVGARTGIEARRFDIIAFSISYENDFVHLADLLLKARLPLFSKSRPDPFPLVIAGGFTMSVNPLPIADLVDAVVVGEAEPVLGALVDAASDAGARGLSKGQLLASLAAIDGIYVPSVAASRARRVWSPVEKIAADPREQVRSHFGEMMLVEVGRGCGRGCHFCAAGSLYRPVRMRPAATVVASAGEARRVGLVGTALGDHPGLVDMLRHFAETGREVGLGSFRADEVTPEVAGLLAACGARTVTLAPEAGSDALRARIGKVMSRQALADAVGMLAGAGIRNIKLYFMIGLPGETDEDVAAIVGLVRELSARRQTARLAVAAAPFVPKPHTAFERCAFIDPESFKRRAALLKPLAATRGVTLKVASYQQALLEALFSRGDRSLARLIADAATEHLSPRAILKRADLSAVHAGFKTEEPLPWDLITGDIPGKGLKAKCPGSKPAPDR